MVLNQRDERIEDPAIVPNRVRASTRTVIVLVACARKETPQQLPPDPQ
jgi:hypothetical protein